MSIDRRLFIMGDVHGQLSKVLGHLRNGRLIDASYDWSGGSSRLWFVGDYFDRGSQGIETIDLIMHLQHDALDEGGEVGALIGNHDVLLLAARRFVGDGRTGQHFIDEWLDNGGQVGDLQRLSAERLTWLQSLPALVLLDEFLLAHADSDFYLRYGSAVETINTAIHAILVSEDQCSWRKLLEEFSTRHVFDDAKPYGKTRAGTFLRKFGASALIHGHTPVDKVTGRDPHTIVQALAYAGGLCINVDGGMYRGAPGFLYEAKP